MAHEIGRKHASKLRAITMICAFTLPFLILVLSTPGHVSAGIALILHLVGLFAGRWLFFAEAEHVVALYYDKHRA